MPPPRRRRSGKLQKMSLDEFVRRLGDDGQPADRRFAFLLGAGCSISSGIPAAGKLVEEDWLPRLHGIKAKDPKQEDRDAWAREALSHWDPQNPGAAYGEIIEALFLTPGERQREIERICTDKQPGCGYAILSGLMIQQHGRFNVVLTTNFDDLVEDALVMFRRTRPLVIQHESLAPFIRSSGVRPLVVKLHGDQRLAPRNTAEETANLSELVAERVATVLHDRGLIVLGYGGNDESIVAMLEDLPEEALPFGIYWVSGSEPRGSVRPWLEERRAVWVDYQDFDEHMVLLAEEFSVPHPDKKRFEKLFATYSNQYKQIFTKMERRYPEAVKASDRAFTHWFRCELEASRYRKTDPDRADKIYRQGIKELGEVPELLGNYALFLTNVRSSHDKAESYYKRAIEADPKDAIALGNYANFLKNVRSSHDEAESYYKRAIEADPKDAAALGNYALFLTDVRSSHDEAESYYKRAIEADPRNAIALGNYAQFLLAEGRVEEGLGRLREAFGAADAKTQPDLMMELWFHAYAHGPEAERVEALAELRKGLVAGAGSEGWDLSRNVQRARQDGHPAGEWLEKLAAVVGKEADVESLSDWESWSGRKAPKKKRKVASRKRKRTKKKT